MNVSQQSCDKNPFQKVVHIWVDRSTWDCWLSSNPHALVIYLEFVLVHGATPERFEECQCENDDVRFHCRTWVLGNGQYCWLRGPINTLPMERQAKYLVRTIHRPFGHLKHKLWLKERSGVKLAVWLPTTKSRESTQFTYVQVTCDIPLESSWWKLQLCFRPHCNWRFA